MKLFRRIALLVLIATLVATMSGQAATGIQSGQTVTALNAVTATVNSSTYQVKMAPGLQLPGNYSWSVVVTGGPTTVSVNLQGSLDGSTWFNLDTSSITTSELRFVTGKPVPYLRVNLATLTGGVSPTVTVAVMASK